MFTASKLPPVTPPSFSPLVLLQNSFNRFLQSISSLYSKGGMDRSKENENPGSDKGDSQRHTKEEVGNDETKEPSKGVLKKSSKENLQHPTNLVSKFDMLRE